MLTFIVLSGVKLLPRCNYDKNVFFKIVTVFSKDMICCWCCDQVLSDRVDALVRQIDDLESKAQSLQTTIDRLNLALTQSVREESSHKDKV